ncbi:MAG TPA: NAD(P)-dependent oxidoreductase, partial [Lentisphaeria bacterium]|nr:NAD(P)-dependent oxidoreductase [Lentisphaeria bacterium]
MNNTDLITNAVYLRHSEVECWNFRANHAQHLQRCLPNQRVLICENEKAFVAALPEADCVMVWTFKQEWFELAPRLRVLSTPSAGRDYFLVEPPPQVRLMYGAFQGRIIAETVVGMILAMTRGLLASATTLADQPWPRKELCSIIRPLRGSHVVILGFGNVGEWIGRMLKPFGVRISGLRRNLRRKPPEWFTADDRLFLEDDLDAVLQTADHVVLALPGSQDTNGILNSPRINLLASHVTICNVGRGNAIEEMPLY